MGDRCLLLHQRVCLEGLQARPDLNGREGVVVAYDQADGRYTVELDGGDNLRPRVKAANLQRASFDAKAVPAQLRARFKRANISARELPSEVFDQTQRLKLYALSKQSEVGAAPAALPEGASELEAAKWAAWDCVRHLDQVQAMKSYTEIIEKLVQLISSSDSGAPPKTFEPPAPLPRKEAASQANAPPKLPRPTPTSASAVRAPDIDVPVGAPDLEVELGPEPTVELTTWSTKGVLIPAGSTTTVPVVIPDTACTVVYSFVASSDTLSGTGYIRFRIGCPGAPSDGAAFVDQTQHRGEGRFEVAAKTGVLLAVLDNEAGWSPVSVAVKVDVTPMAQLLALQVYKEREATVAKLVGVGSVIREQLARNAAIGRTKCSLEEQLQALRAQVTAVQEQLEHNASDMVACDERTTALQREHTELLHKLKSHAGV